MKPLTPAATKLLGAGGLLLCAALGWLVGVGPPTSELADVRVQIVDTQSQNATLAQQVVALEQQSEDLGSTRRTAADLADRFPPTADLPGLFRSVTEAALGAGIGPRGVTTLAPTAPVVEGVDPATGLPDGAGPDAGLARQTVSVAVSGTYEQTRQLLDNLEQMRRAYLITSVTLTAGEPSGVFTTTIAGEMFVMAPLEVPAESLSADSPRTEG